MNCNALRGASLFRQLENSQEVPVLLVSACLLGATCRYDGQSKNADSKLLDALLRRQLTNNLTNAPVLIDLFESAMARKDVQDLRVKQLLGDLLPRGVLPICPEIFGGLSCPRLPADFFDGDGQDLLKGSARLLNRAEEDVSKQFLLGAQLTLSLAQKSRASWAILKEGSPSCGVRRVQREGQKIRGEGVTSALLSTWGIHRWTEEDLMEEALETLPRPSS